MLSLNAYFKSGRFEMQWNGSHLALDGPKVVGSNRTPAIKINKEAQILGLRLFV